MQNRAKTTKTRCWSLFDDGFAIDISLFFSNQNKKHTSNRSIIYEDLLEQLQKSNRFEYHVKKKTAYELLT